MVLEDRGQSTGAIEACTRAVHLDPALAAAQFNLSRLFEATGQRAEALAHLAEYKRLVERGEVGT